MRRINTVWTMLLAVAACNNRTADPARPAQCCCACSPAASPVYPALALVAPSGEETSVVVLPLVTGVQGKRTRQKRRDAAAFRRR
jgi:hypothetical protein